MAGYDATVDRDGDRDPVLVAKSLAKMVCESYDKWKDLRKARRSIMEMYAGDHYHGRLGGDGDAALYPVNMLHRGMHTTATLMTARRPKAEVRPKTVAALRGLCVLLQHRLNFLIEEMRLDEIEYLCTLDAMSMVGVVQTGLAPSNPLEVFGELIDPGRPFVARVSPDCYFVDGQAKDYSERMFEGHSYRTTRCRLLELLDADTIDRIPRSMNSHRGDKTAEILDPVFGDFVELYDLTDVYFPAGVLSRSPMRATLAGSPESLSTYLKTGEGGRDIVYVREPFEYEGPEGGPYTLLRFADVPDSPMPTAPAAFWKTLANMVNALAEHIIEADSTMANIIGVDPTAGDDAVEQLRTAGPQSIIKFDSLGGVQQLTKGGAPDRARESLSMFMQLLNQESGNTDMLSGVRSKAGGSDVTATEVNTLATQLSARLETMTDRLYRFTDEVLRKIAWYDVRDPSMDFGVQIQRAGVNMELRLTADDLSGFEDFDYNIQVQRGSMARRSDEEKASAVTQAAATVFPVAGQIAQMFGDAFNVGAFIRAATNGILEPQELEEIFPDPDLAARNAAKAAAGAPGGKQRRYGLPGTDGQVNGQFTGASSPNFDIESNTEATVEAGA